MNRYVSWLLFASCWSSLAAGQEAQIAVEEPPHYVGEPVTLRIVVRGFDESPQPTVEMAGAASDGLRLQLTALQPSVSRSVQIVQDSSGRPQMMERKSVVWPIDYSVTASRPGEYVVGPFVVRQGGREVRAEAIQLAFEDVAIDPDMRVQLVLPEKPVYPDQRVPVTVVWSYAGDLEQVDRLRIYSPLFDQFQFAPEEKRARRDAVELPIETREGPIALAATVRRVAEADKNFTVVSAERTLIPSRAGKFELEPITATVRKVTRWERSRSPLDDFGFGGGTFGDLLGEGRRPAKTVLTRSVGAPQTLLVKPFPAEGRPASFAGAVGPGYSLEVAADRTVVNVGDPITLTLTLRGSGNLENASLPALSADGGLDPRRFRLPGGEVAGTLDNDGKKFSVTVRVEDEAVSEIPAIAYSWFDPAEEAYRTTRSKPIALRVMPARIVSATDVVTAAKKDPQPPTIAAAPAKGPGPNEGPAAAATPLAFSLSGADLSLERNADALLRGGGGLWSSPRLPLVLYGAGIVLVLVALVDRKRRDEPAESIRLRRLFVQQRRRLEAARRRPPREALAETAGALRALLAEVPGAPRAEAESIIASCETLLYAPSPAEDTTKVRELMQRAIAAAEQLRKDAG